MFTKTELVLIRELLLMKLLENNKKSIPLGNREKLYLHIMKKIDLLSINLSKNE